jgi:hypothetical protein
MGERMGDGGKMVIDYLLAWLIFFRWIDPYQKLGSPRLRELLIYSHSVIPAKAGIQ